LLSLGSRSKGQQGQDHQDEKRTAPHQKASHAQTSGNEANLAAAGGNVNEKLWM
jgi:hypothetical protein